MASGQVPKALRGTLYSLDLGSLFAGAGKGEYEEVRGCYYVSPFLVLIRLYP